MPTGSGDCLQHFEALREGMGEDCGIWFAGEHTSLPGGLRHCYWRLLERRGGCGKSRPPLEDYHIVQLGKTSLFLDSHLEWTKAVPYFPQGK